MQTIERSAGSGEHAVGRVHWRLDDEFDIEAHGASAQGPVRPENEDAFLVADLGPAGGHDLTHRLALLMVADGVGGHRGGAAASRLAVRTALDDASRRRRTGHWSPARTATEVEASLTDVVLASHAALVQAGRSDPALAQMATTLTAALVRGRTLHLAHVGDSRCYLQHGSALRPLTTDHTMARVMAEGGAPLPDTSRLHHVLANALGASHPSVAVEARTIGLDPGDRLLLCSDGLSDALADDTIGTMLAAAPTVDVATRRLLAQALDDDGSDNVTIVVAHIRVRG